MIGSMRAASVVVTHQPQAPERYMRDWVEAAGVRDGAGRVPGALADLARVVEDVRPGDLVPADLLADRGGLVRWLEDRAGDPVFGD